MYSHTTPISPLFKAFVSENLTSRALSSCAIGTAVVQSFHFRRVVDRFLFWLVQILFIYLRVAARDVLECDCDQASVVYITSSGQHPLPLLIRASQFPSSCAHQFISSIVTLKPELLIIFNIMVSNHTLLHLSCKLTWDCE